MRNRGKKSWKLKIVLGAGILVVCCFPALLAADSITGVVRNQTQGRPAVGDEVILLGLGQNAQEEARAKTDWQGAFTLEVRHSDRPHLVRVIHQSVSYDRRVSAGNAIAIEVADAAAKVKGITGGIEIIRAGAHGNLLHVSEMVEIENLSNPPVTEAKKRTFEVYLPGDAKIDSVLAAGPENIGAAISAVPSGGEPGHYTVDFPLRPGSTKFAFNYDLPYGGRVHFHTKNMYPLQQLAVMIPPTMTFTSRSPAFQILPVGNDKYKVEAAEQLKAGEGPEFEISGIGTLPSMQAQVHAPPGAVAGAPAAPSLAAPSRLQVQAPSLGTMPVSKSSTLSAQPQWWILGAGAVLILGTCGLLVVRRKRPPIDAITKAAHGTEQGGQRSAFLVGALKEGLFQLESDRLQGAIPREEYAVAKQALEGTIEWALARAGARGGTRRQHLSRDV